MINLAGFFEPVVHVNISSNKLTGYTSNSSRVSGPTGDGSYTIRGTVYSRANVHFVSITDVSWAADSSLNGNYTITLTLKSGKKISFNLTIALPN